MISYNESLIDRNEFISSMFFASGFIPLIQSVVFDMLPRFIQETGFQLEDAYSILLSVGFLALALFLYPKPEEEEDSWDIVCGKTLFEAGLIYFITRLLFFVPNPLDEARKLKNEIEDLKQSMAIGLADGYFWNLVREIAVDIRDAAGPQGSLKLKYGRDKDGKFLEKNKFVKRFLILVPRELDWVHVEDPIAKVINLQKFEKKTFQDCKIQKSANRMYSTREKWVTDLIGISSEISKVNTQTHPTGIVFDIPTTITAVLMSLRDHSTSGSSSDSTITNAATAKEGGSTSTTTNTVTFKNIDREKFQKEMSTFTHRISWQLKKAHLDEYVKVIEVDNLDNIVEKIISVHKHLEDEDLEMSQGAKVS